MAFKLNITAKPGATSYKIYRSTSPVDIYDQPPLAEQDELVYIDRDLLDKTLYYYGVESLINGVLTDQSAVTPIYHLSDWGPFEDIVAQNIAATGNPYLQGSGKNGLIYVGEDSPIFPDVISIENHDQLNSVTGSTYPIMTNKGTGVSVVMVMDGKLIALRNRSSSTGDLRLSMSTAANSVILNNCHKFMSGLNALTSDENVYVFSGFKWRLKIFTKQDLQYTSTEGFIYNFAHRHSRLIPVRDAAFNDNQSNYNTNVISANSPEDSPALVFQSLTGISYANGSSSPSLSNPTLMHYFEYVGPA